MSRVELNGKREKGPNHSLHAKSSSQDTASRYQDTKKTGSSFKISQGLISVQGFYTTQREEDVHMRFNFRHPPKEGSQEPEGQLSSDFLCTIK